MFSVKKKKKKVLFPDHFFVFFLFHLILIYQSSALIGVSIALIKYHDQKTNWGGKKYFGLHLPCCSSLKKSGQGPKQGNDLEAGDSAEAKE